MKTRLTHVKPPGPLPMLAVLGGIMSFICLTALWSSPGQANGLDQFGFGARAQSMGGAFTSLSNDMSAAYYNPAGFAQGDDIRLDFGYLYANPNLSYNTGDSNTDLVKGMQGGITLPGTIGDVGFGVGVGIFVLDDRLTRVRSLPQEQPRFVLFDNRVQRMFISADFALEPLDGFFLGFGVVFFANTIANLDMSGTVSLNDVENTRLEGGIRADIESARYFTAGLMYNREDLPWSIGLMFRDEFFLRLEVNTFVDGDIVIDVDPENPIVLVEDASFILESLNANLFTPRSLVLGLSYDFGPLLVAADLGWHQWSAFPAPSSQIDIDLDLGTLDFSIPPLDPILDPNFADIFVPRIGFEAPVVDTTHFDLALRTGYFFEDTPAPDQPGLTNYVDAAKHGISFGLGMAFSEFTSILPKPMVLDLSFLYVRMVERVYIKDDPTNRVGDYTIDGHMFSGSLILGINL